jgi:hypothetical protein
MNNDPFLSYNAPIERLINDYRKHKSLVIALDFDNTIHDCHKKGYEFPSVIQLVKRCKNDHGFKIVIFSASPKERYGEIRAVCQELGIEIDGINCDVVDWIEEKNKQFDYNRSKIFFNILLDDRAGLLSAYNTLFDTLGRIDKEKYTQS